MSRRNSRGSKQRPRSSRAQAGRAPRRPDILALRRAREELTKLRFTTSEIQEALRELDAVLAPYETECRTFEVSLTAIVEMRTDTRDLKYQIAKALLEYLAKGIHLDANYLAEVIDFKEI